MNTEAGRSGWFDRVLAASCYLGFAPLLLLARRRERPFLHHHFTRGLIAVLLFLFLILSALAGLGVITHVLLSPVSSPALQEDIGKYVAYALVGPLVLWLIPWLAGLLCAAFGSTRRVLPDWVARRWCVRAGLVGNLLAWAAGLFLAALLWQADSIARDDIGPAPVYVLVDKRGAEKAIPHVAVKLASYRLAWVARERWGEGSTVVAPLNEQSLRAALRHGRLVMIWSHGSDGNISMPDGWATVNGGPYLVFGRASSPKEWEPVPFGEHLQFLYCSACHGGAKKDLWVRSLAPARVVTYDRLSGGLEHILWLWFTAPERAREVR
jgi:hypothetical protein